MYIAFFCIFIGLFQYDYDNDGMREVMLATADGAVIVVSNDGTILEGETFLVRDRDNFITVH